MDVSEGTNSFGLKVPRSMDSWEGKARDRVALFVTTKEEEGRA